MSRKAKDGEQASDNTGAADPQQRRRAFCEMVLGIAEQLVALHLESRRYEIGRKKWNDVRRVIARWSAGYRSIKTSLERYGPRVRDALLTESFFVEIGSLIEKTKTVLANRDGSGLEAVARHWLEIVRSFETGIDSFLLDNGEEWRARLSRVQKALPEATDAIEAGGLLGSRKEGKPRKNEARKRSPRETPTHRQTQIYAKYLELGSLAKTAKHFGISKAAAGKSAKAAKEILDGRSRSVKARQRIPGDRRGQPTVTDD